MRTKDWKPVTAAQHNRAVGVTVEAYSFEPKKSEEIRRRGRRGRSLLAAALAFIVMGCGGESIKVESAAETVEADSGVPLTNELLLPGEINHDPGPYVPRCN